MVGETNGDSETAQRRGDVRLSAVALVAARRRSVALGGSGTGRHGREHHRSVPGTARTSASAARQSGAVVSGTAAAAQAAGAPRQTGSRRLHTADGPPRARKWRPLLAITRSRGASALAAAAAAPAGGGSARTVAAGKARTRARSGRETAQRRGGAPALVPRRPAAGPMAAAAAARRRTTRPRPRSASGAPFKSAVDRCGKRSKSLSASVHVQGRWALVHA